MTCVQSPTHMGVLLFTRKAEPLFGRKRGNDSLQLVRYGDFCDKKSPPSRRRGMRGVGHLRGRRWKGD